jgi:TetR/AcrR family transcriptional regulator, transcriptional repressor for nem operon
MPKVKLFNEDTALALAKNVFWKKGYNATSMQDLVEGMQISRQSLYDTYGNKEGLFIKCLQQYQLQASNYSCGMLNPNENVFDVLHNFFNNVVEAIITDKQQKGCFIMNTLIELVPEHKLAKKIVFKNYEELERAFCNLFAHAQKNNHYTSSFSILELATHFITALHGIKIVGKIKKDRDVLQALVKTAMSVIQPVAH